MAGGDGAMSMFVCLVVSSLLLGSHVDACYLRNCPIGGKRGLALRTLNADSNNAALSHWFDQLDFHPHAVS